MVPRMRFRPALCLVAGLALSGAAAGTAGAGAADASAAATARAPRFADVTPASGLPARGQTSGAALRARQSEYPSSLS